MKLIALLCVVAAISLAKVELFDQMSMIKEVNTPHHPLKEIT